MGLFRKKPKYDIIDNVEPAVAKVTREDVPYSEPPRMEEPRPGKDVPQLSKEQAQYLKDYESFRNNVLFASSDLAEMSSTERDAHIINLLFFILSELKGIRRD